MASQPGVDIRSHRIKIIEVSHRSATLFSRLFHERNTFGAPGQGLL